MHSVFPDSIGPWQPERLLGRGAMAAVYLARDPSGRVGAVKWMDQAHDALVRRFEREIRSLRRLDHPGIVGILDHGVQDGRPWYAMEHIDGSDLRLYAEKLHQRPTEERYARCRTIGRALAEVLGHLHDRGLVHRDVKPSNVILAQDGRVVLTDFGVVKDLLDDDRTQAGLLVGTPAYAAPEQVEGEPVDARADLFGLGATLYFVLTLRLPFESRDRTPGSRPPPPSDLDPGVPPDLEAVVLRLMAHQPEHRYGDAATVEAALAADSGGGVPIAGRQAALRAAAEALDLARGGVAVHVQPIGPRGVGKGWLSDTLRQGGRRRGVPVYEARTVEEATAPLDRIRGGQAAVLVSPLDLDLPPGMRRVAVPLPPLGVADVRRTVVAAAPLTPDPAQVAERLHRLTGGLPGLLVPVIQRARIGQSLSLPPGPADLPDIVETYLDELDLDEQEALQVLALAPEPITSTVVEEVVHAPADEILLGLTDRGLVKSVGRRWHVSADAFRQAALARCWDPEGLAERVARALQRRAADDPPLPETLATLIGQGEALAGRGRLAAAQALALRAAGTAHAIHDRGQEGAALCLLGQVLLDLGRAAEASARLADATALARATDQPALRRVSHALRAQANLVSRRADRVACASAIDRLIPITSRADHRPTELGDALAFATLAWATGALGDARTATRMAAAAEARQAELAPLRSGRVSVLLARADLARRAPEDARARLASIDPLAAAWPLLGWQSRRLEAALDGTEGPGPGALADGLTDDEAQRLAAWR